MLFPHWISWQDTWTSHDVSLICSEYTECIVSFSDSHLQPQNGMVTVANQIISDDTLTCWCNSRFFYLGILSFHEEESWKKQLKKNTLDQGRISNVVNSSRNKGFPLKSMYDLPHYFPCKLKNHIPRLNYNVMLKENKS